MPAIWQRAALHSRLPTRLPPSPRPPSSYPRTQSVYTWLPRRPPSAVRTIRRSLSAPHFSRPTSSACRYLRRVSTATHCPPLLHLAEPPPASSRNRHPPGQTPVPPRLPPFTTPSPSAPARCPRPRGTAPSTALIAPPERVPHPPPCRTPRVGGRPRGPPFKVLFVAHRRPPRRSTYTQHSRPLRIPTTSSPAGPARRTFTRAPYKQHQSLTTAAPRSSASCPTDPPRSHPTARPAESRLRGRRPRADQVPVPCR
jgi:hypothetical protein